MQIMANYLIKVLPMKIILYLLVSLTLCIHFHVQTEVMSYKFQLDCRIVLYHYLSIQTLSSHFPYDPD